MEFDTRFFNEFADIISQQDGYALGRTVSPDISNESLKRIFRSQNAHNVKNALKRGLQGNAALVGGLEHQEIQGWVDIYASYWNATGVLLTAREANGGTGKVSG